MEFCVEDCKRQFTREVDELEEEVKILSERLKKARTDIDSIKCREDAEEFADKHDLEEGLILIKLF